MFFPPLPTGKKRVRKRVLDMNTKSLIVRPLKHGIEVAEAGRTVIVDDITIYDENCSWIAVISAKNDNLIINLRDVEITFEKIPEAGIVHLNIKKREVF